MPLADELRPTSLDEVVGQSHLIGNDGPLRKIIESTSIPNMIFYGPPGIGKTTIARLIASYSDKQYYRLNGTTASLSDLKAVMDESNSVYASSGIILYLDEIQYLNKKQQQSLLEYIENGKVTLIASTTENPYFYIYNALLSRCVVFEFKSVTPSDLLPAIQRGYQYIENKNHIHFDFEDEALSLIANNSGGDVRKALNMVEMSYILCRGNNENILISYDAVKRISYNNGMVSDRDGDNHYDFMSGLQKSIRGSDVDAALFYLAKLLNAGDLLSPCRRLLVIACEDIGMAYPTGISIVKACVDSATQLGLPEARIPLAHAVTVLATAPKSNSAYLAMDAALADVQAGLGNQLPRCIQNKHYDGKGEEVGQNYIYPHDFENDYVYQQYLPNDLKNKKYYIPSNNRHEQQIEAYWKNIKSQKAVKKKQ